MSAAPDIPLLLVGDLNATPTSAWLRRFMAPSLGLRRVAWQSSTTLTWGINNRAPLLLALDHAFVNAASDLAVAFAGQRHGSDHRPLHLIAVPNQK